MGRKYCFNRTGGKKEYPWYWIPRLVRYIIDNLKHVFTI